MVPLYHGLSEWVCSQWCWWRDDAGRLIQRCWARIYRHIIVFHWVSTAIDSMMTSYHSTHMHALAAVWTQPDDTCMCVTYWQHSDWLYVCIIQLQSTISVSMSDVYEWDQTTSRTLHNQNEMRENLMTHNGGTTSAISFLYFQYFKSVAEAHFEELISVKVNDLRLRISEPYVLSILPAI